MANEIVCNYGGIAPWEVAAFYCKPNITSPTHKPPQKALLCVF